MNFNINIDYDLGNIWELLTAIGTVSAVVISLWFTFRKPKYKNVEISGKIFSSASRNISFTIDNDGGKLLKIIDAGVYIYSGSKWPKKLKKINEPTIKYYLRNVGLLGPKVNVVKSVEDEEIRMKRIINPYENVGYVSSWSLEKFEEQFSDSPKNTTYKYYVKFDDGHEILSSFFTVDNNQIINIIN
ncbi:hypothetical protein AB4027_06910 [Alkalibacterium putridalgicola]|uniref:hypothetical protein n=1 Tax=Alkalibacterium putridalgicola TaxID=426703 RepID=UPI0034CD8F1F